VSERQPVFDDIIKSHAASTRGQSLCHVVGYLCRIVVYLTAAGRNQLKPWVGLLGLKITSA
jgi:hypothetical protein